MKRFLLLLSFALLGPATVIGQCTVGSAFGSLTADTTVFTPQTITTCNYAGEYATITLPVGVWTFTSSVSTDFLTLTNTSNTVLDTATGPLTYTNLAATTVRLHITTSNACGTQNSCRTTSAIYNACTGGSPFGSLTALNNFNLQTISTCNYAGEYATVTLPTGGQWTFSTSDTGDFLVITTPTNQLISQGTTPVAVSLASGQVVRMYIYTDSECGTESVCRDSYVQKSPCLATSAYGSATTSAAYFDTVNISTCNYAGEYATVTIADPGNFVFISSDTGDVMVITTTSNDFLASGQHPLVYNSPGNEVVRVHYFTDGNCGTESVCRTTAVYRLPCLATSQYPFGVDTANTTPVPLEITSCNYAGEFFEVYLDTHTYVFESDSDDVFFFTDTNNNFFFAEPAPSIGTVSGGPIVLRVHIFKDSACTEDTDCRTTTVTCLSCPVPMPMIVPSDTSICQEEGPVTLTAQEQFGDETYWYTTCGGTPIDSGSSISVDPAMTTTYYAANRYDSLFSECDSATVTVNPRPELNFTTIQDVLCNGDTSGSATASGSGGTAPYVYAWSNGGNMATATGLGAGDVTVTITDDNGCSTIDTATIMEPDALALSASTLQNVLCNGETSGEIDVDVTGGTSPYNYSWSNGSSSSSTGGVAAGTYTLTVLDGNGCVETFTETLTEPDAITNSFTVTDAVCESSEEGGIVSSIAGGTTPYTYNWSNGNTSSDLSNVASGQYVLTVTDDNGCEFLDSATIGFEFADPIIPLDSVMILCKGFDLTLDAGNAGSSFLWNTSETTQSIVVTSAGTYSVAVTDGNGCEADKTIEVVEDDCVGITELGDLVSIETFPNPTRDILNIRIQNATSEQVTIDLMNVAGQIVSTRIISGGNSEHLETMDVRGLSQGVYQLKFSVDGRSATKRVIIQ